MRERGCFRFKGCLFNFSRGEGDQSGRWGGEEGGNAPRSKLAFTTSWASFASARLDFPGTRQEAFAVMDSARSRRSFGSSSVGAAATGARAAAAAGAGEGGGTGFALPLGLAWEGFPFGDPFLLAAIVVVVVVGVGEESCRRARTFRPGGGGGPNATLRWRVSSQAEKKGVLKDAHSFFVMSSSSPNPSYFLMPSPPPPPS